MDFFVRKHVVILINGFKNMETFVLMSPKWKDLVRCCHSLVLSLVQLGAVIGTAQQNGNKIGKGYLEYFIWSLPPSLWKWKWTKKGKLYK